ncbi:unnamed protein product [Lymnaea stagnalis]|uniref:Alkylglycerol monooxygenase n=1 Tax=Lymnaea stagnalis TaxID=6523 RepID=A0AAV2HIY1_LYMST
MDTRSLSSYGLNFRALFYMVTPNETSYEKFKDVPNFVQEAVPYCTILMVLECLLLKLQGKDLPRINDGVNSMTHGLLSALHVLLFRAIELVIYVWIYHNWRFIDLPWNNPWTWILGMVCTDFLYYWFHRLSHESNIVWASHQVHHSSEDYNFTTALRQSLMQRYYCMLMYFPMALCIPPTVFHVHQQFNLLFQFWLHTEVVTTLGPLEYIFNTPSHHRVHHGRNPYCIDKNFAGTLIIWDRIFNTFQAEGEKVEYGLVHPNNFWSPLYGQFYYYWYIVGLVRKYKGLANKLSAVFKGPGWEPGKPWRGLYEEIPEVQPPVKKYNSNLPWWANVYVLIHFTLVFAYFGLVAPYKKQMTFLISLGFVAFFIYSVSVFGVLYDHRKYGYLLEFLRCVLTLVVIHIVSGHVTVDMSFATALMILYVVSAALWVLLGALNYDIYDKNWPRIEDHGIPLDTKVPHNMKPIAQRLQSTEDILPEKPGLTLHLEISSESVLSAICAPTAQFIANTNTRI